MTAIVGILNKRSIALAADSAVTINSPSGHKVLNSANKVFSLSKKHPVGVMLYASASFMDTPWDIIIKMYRDQLNDKSHSTLNDYVADFVKYLKGKNFFCSENMQKQYLLRHMEFYYNDVRKIATQNCINQSKQPAEQIPSTIVHNEMLNVLEHHSNYYATRPKCPDFENYTINDLQSFATNEIDSIQNVFQPHVLDVITFREVFVKSFTTYICSDHISFDRTGLVFVGYGEDEIYPSLIPLNVSFAMDNKLRGCIETAMIQHITENNKAAICPFAQTDVMMTILTGVDGGIKNLAYATFDKTIESFLNVIIGDLQSKNVDTSIISAIKGIDLNVFSELFKKSINDFINNEYIIKLVETVEYLEKEDLANMAESLIALTGLKRRMTSSEESVGGPVDVAIISKSDGFIWMKRKHYFNKELNAQFFQRYNQ